MTSATADQPFVFSPSAAPTGGNSAAPVDSLVNETRREISDIVREVAAAVRSERTTDEFLTLLVDRTLRAMAAEGVIVWRREESLDQAAPLRFEPIRQLGRVTDTAIPTVSLAAHQRMLIEVANDGQPVVVPATPGAIDPEMPANPMDVPVAVVPIESGSVSLVADYMLEAFLEPDGGAATQRGYLRFVAQMADLAGEFLRADQLRRLHRGQRLGRRVDAAIAKLHEPASRRQTEAAIVDHAAELFAFDRVGLCHLDEHGERLVAVSHVNTIDARSPAATQILEATIGESEDECQWFDCEDHDDEELAVRAVVHFAHESLCLVCLETSGDEPTSSECQAELIRYLQHAEIALGHHDRLDAIPGSRLFSALAPAIKSHRASGWTRPIVTVLALTLLLVIAMFPLPLVVYSPATLRAADVQTVSAPRDATVDQIHVDHGQSVLAGDKLLTMIDPDLQQQVASLLGRRAVLVQQQSRWTEALVDTGSHRVDHSERLQGERSLVAEEIRATDEQLAILQSVQKSLVIRADRDGVVDAWRAKQQLQGRPLQRGDLMLRVVAHESPWLLDARVPQSRISHIQEGTKNERLVARVSLDSNPDVHWDASLAQIGPAIESPHDAVATTAVRLRLSDEAANSIAAKRESGSQFASTQAGAPARVMFECGTAPAAYLLFQDMIRSVRGTCGLYFASQSQSHGDPS